MSYSSLKSFIKQGSHPAILYWLFIFSKRIWMDKANPQPKAQVALGIKFLSKLDKSMFEINVAPQFKLQIEFYSYLSRKFLENIPQVSAILGGNIENPERALILYLITLHLRTLLTL